MEIFNKNKRFAFTLAEMMVVLFVLSVVAAAFLPIITTRSKTSSAIWRYAANNSDIYFGRGSTQGAAIGVNSLGGEKTKLLLNKPDATYSDIIFKQNGTKTGDLSLDSNNNTHLGTYADQTPSSTSVVIGSNIELLSATQSGLVLIGNTVKSDITTGNSIAIGTSAKTYNDNNVVIGYGAQSSGDIAIGASANSSDGIAIGNSANGRGLRSIAIGFEAQKNAPGTNDFADTIAIGYDSQANNYGIAVGSSPHSNALYTVALGYNSIASYNFNTALGSDSEASNTGCTAIGGGAKAFLIGGSSLGQDAHANGERSTTLGYLTSANARSTSVGSQSHADSDDSVALGYAAKANISNNVAIGSEALANSQGYAIAIGRGAEVAGGTGSIAIGGSAGTTGGASSNYAIAIGYTASSTALSAISMGVGADADGQYGVSIGANSKAYGDSSVALGNLAVSDASLTDGSIAIGKSATADGYSTAIGSGAEASAQSIAIGYNVKANVGGGVNTVVIGFNTDNSALTDGGIQLGDSSNYVYIPGRLFVKSNEIIVNSDRRLKNVNGEFTSGLSELRQLPIFNYTFKDDKKKNPRVGVMAQDLQKIFPDAVTKDKKGFLAIRQEDMFYAMMNSIKELDVIVQGLVNDFKGLVARIQTLDDKIIALIKVDQIFSKRISALEKQNALLIKQNKALEIRLTKLEKQR